MERQFKAAQLVGKLEIERSDSVVLVLTEKQLLAKVYEEADFPRDFRTRIVHRETPLTDSILVEVFLDVIDASNPRVDYDPDWFKERALPRTGDLTSEQQRVLDRWGLGDALPAHGPTGPDGPPKGKSAQDSLSDLIKTVYEREIQSSLAPNPLMKSLSMMQWAGGTFVQVVSEQTLLKLDRDDDVRLMEERAYQMAHESMRRKAMEDHVPLSSIRCTHYADYDPMVFQRRYLCKADPVYWIPDTSNKFFPGGAL